jgi:hypothetical protein
VSIVRDALLGKTHKEVACRAVTRGRKAPAALDGDILIDDQQKTVSTAHRHIDCAAVPINHLEDMAF